MIKNDATSGLEGAESSVGDKYATLSEQWRKLTKGDVIPHRIKKYIPREAANLFDTNTNLA